MKRIAIALVASLALLAACGEQAPTAADKAAEAAKSAAEATQLAAEQAKESAAKAAEAVQKAADALVTDWHGQGPGGLPGGVLVGRAGGLLAVRGS
jgi:tRNA(Ile)-lysidine synthase